jgi:hypothetical protein
MDLARVRFGDWVMALGGVAVLVVMFVDWYSTPELFAKGQGSVYSEGYMGFNAWEAFTVNDAILAAAAVMALVGFVLTAAQPTAAVPLALASLTTLVSAVAFVLVAIRLIWPPELWTEGLFEPTREAGAWLGLVATSVLLSGCLASIRDERMPQPEQPVEPRLVQL